MRRQREWFVVGGLLLLLLLPSPSYATPKEYGCPTLSHAGGSDIPRFPQGAQVKIWESADYAGGAGATVHSTSIATNGCFTDVYDCSAGAVEYHIQIGSGGTAQLYENQIPCGDGGSGASVTAMTADTGGQTTGNVVDLEGGDGIVSTRSGDTVSVATESTEGGFLHDTGTSGLSCTPGDAAATNGAVTLLNDGRLCYCDGSGVHRCVGLSTYSNHFVDGGTTNLTCAGNQGNGSAQTMDDGRIQWCDGGGHLRSTSAALQVRDYGAACDGSADDTDEMQAAIDALPTRGGTIEACTPIKLAGFSVVGKPARILFDAGLVTLTDSMLYQNVEGAYLGGSGGGPTFSSNGSGTIFNWSGSSYKPMLYLQDVSHSVFENFRLGANPSTARAVAGIASENSTSFPAAPTKNVYRNLFMTGTDGDGFQKCMVWWAPLNANCLGFGNPYPCCGGPAWGSCTGVDAGNDFATIENVTCNRPRQACYSIEATQSQGHEFHETFCLGVLNTYYGWTNAIGAANQVGGNFHVSGGGASNVLLADVYVAPASANAIVIEKLNSEKSNRALDTTSSSANQPITLLNNRFTFNDANNNSTLASDGKAIRMQNGGPLELINNLIGSLDTVALQVALDCGAGPNCHGTAIGNTLRTQLAQPFTANASGHWTISGNFRGAAAASFAAIGDHGYFKQTTGPIACSAGTISQTYDDPASGLCRCDGTNYCEVADPASCGNAYRCNGSPTPSATPTATSAAATKTTTPTPTVTATLSPTPSAATPTPTVTSTP